MRREKSVGAVVYKVEKGRILFLLELMGHGHTSLPKGHMEGKETEVETATREILEETDLDVTIDNRFRKEIKYNINKDVVKTVVFFVARYDGHKKPIDIHDEEVLYSFFMPFEEAFKTLTFDNDKDVLKAAYEYILKNHLIN